MLEPTQDEPGLPSQDEPLTRTRNEEAVTNEHDLAPLIDHIKLRSYDLVGQAYFQELVETLSEVLGVVVAFIGQLSDESLGSPIGLDSQREKGANSDTRRNAPAGEVGFSLIASFYQERVRNTSATVFPLPRDIFHHLQKGDPVVIPSYLASYIPHSALKAFPDSHLESCCIIALKSHSGRIIGILGIATNAANSKHLHAMAPDSATSPFAASVLKQLSRRASNELERSTELHHLKIESAAAQAATKSKTHFLANMSHEIRTPVSAIIGLTDMILWDSNDLQDEQRNRLELINSSGEHLLAVINDILDLSKIGDEDLKFVLQERPFSLRRCLKEAVHLASMSPNLAQKRILVVDGSTGAASASAPNKAKTLDSGLSPPLTLRWDVDPSVPETIIGDTTRLRQIIMNLLSNALKFTTRGAVTLTVSRVPTSPITEEAVDGGDLFRPPQNLDRRFSMANSPSFPASISSSSSLSAASSATNILHSEIMHLPNCTTPSSSSSSQPQSTNPQRVALIFSVLDTGIGIPRAKINRLFIPFSQIDNEVTRGSGIGTGLGLAISSRLVQMMGGHIWVESAQGVGSKFAFMIGVREAREGTRLTDHMSSSHGMLHTGGPSSSTSSSASNPYHSAAESASLADHNVNGPVPMSMESIQNGSILQPAPLEATTSLADGITTVQDHSMSRERRNARINRDLAKMYPIKILIAEDNAINQQIALSVLKKMGYEADVAWNGREVLQKIVDEGKKYDLILMDICMPYLDGLATTRELVAKQLTIAPSDSCCAALAELAQDNRAGTPQIVIIALTASATTDDRSKCEQAGMHDWLAKPFKPLELQEKIAKHFGHLMVRAVATAAEPEPVPTPRESVVFGMGASRRGSRGSLESVESTHSISSVASLRSQPPNTTTDSCMTIVPLHTLAPSSSESSSDPPPPPVQDPTSSSTPPLPTITPASPQPPTDPLPQQPPSTSTAQRRRSYADILAGPKPEARRDSARDLFPDTR